MEEQLTNTPEFAEVVDIQFRPGQKIYFFDPAGMKLQAMIDAGTITADQAVIGYVGAFSLSTTPVHLPGGKGHVEREGLREKPRAKGLWCPS